MNELVATSGQPLTEDHSTHSAQYRRDSWIIDVQFTNEKIASITYAKLDPLTETDIQQLLKIQSTGETWKQIGFAGMKVRNWMRSDYAMAVYDPKFPRVLRFSGGRYKPNSALPSTTPAPLARSVTSYPSHAAPEERKTPLSTPYATTPVRTSNQPSSSRPNGIAIFLAIAALLVAAFTKGKWGRQQKVSSLPPPLPANVPEPSSFNEKLTLDSLTWEQFELLIGLIYQRQGWEVAISGGLGPDGGIDVTLTRGSEKVLVQCKHRKDPVKVEEIRELFGVHMAERSTRAIFITSGEYTKPGLQFAEGKDIEMINRTQLLRLIGEVTRPGENLFRVNQWVKQFEEEVNIFTPTCPRCSATMSLKSGPGWRRWYCSRPRCRGDRKARADLHYHMVLE